LQVDVLTEEHVQLGGMFLEVLSPPTYAQIAAMGEDVTFT
jgi:hypothetical protein